MTHTIELTNEEIEDIISCIKYALERSVSERADEFTVSIMDKLKLHLSENVPRLK